MQSIADCTTLHNGVDMPWLGLGVFRASQGGEVEQAIQWAVDIGYRSIDTATVYNNEEGVGEGVRRSGVPREQLFITTKVWNSDQGYDRTLKAFEASLQRLGMDYVDLYLIHWPVAGKFQDTWRALEELYGAGKAKAIGVSNFLVPHLEDLLAGAKIVPMVNQVEFHPYLVQSDLLGFCSEHEIRVEAWSPLMKGNAAEEPTLTRLGAKYGKSAVQLVLRWDLQHEVITIPKSVHRDRIAANADIFDFEISEEDMEAIDALDRGKRFGPDPNNFAF
ncbi:MAG: aldo/keto reductase [Candidatus Hydrogenedentota bacterium]